MRTSPSLISSNPATIRSAVVLPQPEGPDEDDELPVGDFEIEPVDRERSITVDLGDTVKDDASH